MSSLTDKDLNEMFQNWPFQLEVTSVDILNRCIPEEKTSYFIVNTSPYPHPGHWCLIILKELKCEFFDSLGLDIEYQHYNIKKFIKKHSSIVLSSTLPIQSVFSKKCGLFVIARILSFIINEELEEFLSRFSENTLENDKKVMDLINIYSSYFSFFNFL